MNTYYAKSILYAYPNLEEIMEQIDELVERKAISSMNDTSPALIQCNAILNYTNQKDVLIEIKLVVDSILSKFDENELFCLDYKFFKSHTKEYYDDFDTSSRNYFRRQVRVAEKFALYLENRGIDNKWFEKNCLPIDFFSELLKRVIEHERLSHKNKSVKEKKLIKKKVFEECPLKTTA